MDVIRFSLAEFMTRHFAWIRAAHGEVEGFLGEAEGYAMTHAHTLATASATMAALVRSMAFAMWGQIAPTVHANHPNAALRLAPVLLLFGCLDLALNPWLPGGSASGLCDDSCTYISDGFCDDGGPGSEYGLCDVGKDCEDCTITAIRTLTRDLPLRPIVFSSSDGAHWLRRRTSLCI